MATTDRSYYIITWRPEYARLVGYGDDALERVVVSISQGGFGEDVADFERQVKERFLETEFDYQGLDLERTADVFDAYFTLEEPDQVVDLDSSQ